MNLLKRFRLTRELGNLERKARENPSPSTFIDLAQVYINLGWPDHTLRVAEEGLLLFPRSKELRKVFRHARRQVLENKVKDLSSRIGENPDPKVYRELAEAYHSLGDRVSFLRVCEECLKRHPDDVPVRVLAAREKLKGFMKELKAQDGIEALADFLAVLDLEPDHVETHRFLGEFLYQIGAHSLSYHHLNRVVELGKADPEVRRILESIGKPDDSEADPTRLLYEVEAKGRLPFRISVSETKLPGMASAKTLRVIREGLAAIIAIEGVQKAAYIRGSKALVKGEIRSGKDPFLKTIRIVAKASQRAVRRMDLGNFSKGTVEGGFGNLCICSFGDVCAAVQCRRSAAVERILQELQNLVAGSLFSMSSVEA